MIVKKKIWPEFFEKVLSGKKKFELRLQGTCVSSLFQYGVSTLTVLKNSRALNFNPEFLTLGDFEVKEGDVLLCQGT